MSVSDGQAEGRFSAITITFEKVKQLFLLQRKFQLHRVEAENENPLRQRKLVRAIRLFIT